MGSFGGRVARALARGPPRAGAAAVKLKSVTHHLVPQIACDLGLKTLDLVGAELDHLAGVDIDDVVVVGQVGGLEARRGAFKGMTVDDALGLERGERAVDGGERDRFVDGAGAAVQLVGVGMVLCLRQHLENRRALARDSHPVGTQGLLELLRRGECVRHRRQVTGFRQAPQMSGPTRTAGAGTHLAGAAAARHCGRRFGQHSDAFVQTGGRYAMTPEADAARRGAADVATRQEAIVLLAREQGRVTVDALAVRFAVTPQTIRKDLNDLAARRLVARVHGGAVTPSGTANLEYEKRKLLASAQKAAIGRVAARLVPDAASLFINIGTTTEAVSEALLDHGPLMVITNNINVANRMRLFPQFEVVIAGGVVRGSDGGVVGEAAVDFIRQFKVDYAVVGASAIDLDGALLDFDLREVKVAQAIIENARHVILACDASKVGRAAPVRIGHLRQIHSFVTDRCPAPLAAVCRAHGVRLYEAGEDPPGARPPEAFV